MYPRDERWIEFAAAIVFLVLAAAMAHWIFGGGI